MKKLKLPLKVGTLEYTHRPGRLRPLTTPMFSLTVGQPDAVLRVSGSDMRLGSNEITIDETRVQLPKQVINLIRAHIKSITN